MITIGGRLVVVAAAGPAFAYFVIFPRSSPRQLALTAFSTVGASNDSGKSLAATWRVATGSQAG